jgi:chromosome segregation ATPase
VRHEQTESTLRSEFSTFKDQAKAKIAELQSQLNEINVQCSLITSDKNDLAFQLEEAAQRLVSLNATHTALVKEKEMLVGDNAKLRGNLTKLDTEAARFQRECNEQTRRLKEERDKLKVTLNDFEKLKQLEFDSLMSNAQATQFATNQQIKAMSEKANARLV